MDVNSLGDWNVLYTTWPKMKRPNVTSPFGTTTKPTTDSFGPRHFLFVRRTVEGSNSIDVVSLVV